MARVGLLRQGKKYHKYNFYVANVTPESVCVGGGGGKSAGNPSNFGLMSVCTYVYLVLINY